MPTGFYPRKPMKERFMEKVQTGDGCWRWIGAIGTHGYGRFGHEGKTHQAHRVSHAIFNGPVPDGLDVMHSCDNRWCVNPAHLSLGTRKDNMSDCSTKGRSTFGERSGLSKLTADQVKEIRQRYAAGDVTQDELGKQFGVSGTNIHHIVARKSWQRGAV